MWLLLQWLDPPLPVDIPAPARMVGCACASLGRTNSEDAEESAIRFDFDLRDTKSLSSVQRASFRSDFHREMTTIRAWLAQQGPWSSLPSFELSVRISDAFKISRALVPAWEGHRGAMEFPAWRVAAGKAAILHELVHLYLPNGNRFLAEGLATYLQACLGGNSAFPNFGRPLHDVARDCLIEIAGESATALDSVQLVELDATPTPNPMTLTSARRRYAKEGAFQSACYAIAGSFVEFLIEIEGLERFQRLYERSPLVPGRLAAGPPERWSEIYGCPLAMLEAAWKSRLIGTQGDERARESAPICGLS